MMSWVKQRYHDISPVTLQVVGGAVSSNLYCGEVDGLSLVESFLVELYRCKLCQFTCGLKTTISSHQLLRHRSPALPYLGPDGRDGVEAGLQQGASPYQLDLNGESKQSDEDEEFLLYNMLDNMSPSTCDISSEGGLQVAHTCEVTHTHTPGCPFICLNRTNVHPGAHLGHLWLSYGPGSPRPTEHTGLARRACGESFKGLM